MEYALVMLVTLYSVPYTDGSYYMHVVLGYSGVYYMYM